MVPDCNIAALAPEWQERLRHCKYVGEIYLHADLLNRLAEQFNWYTALQNSLYASALLVLAVNCAYHYYDEEGFWTHFCRLLRIENSPANHEMLGRVIERQLELLGLRRVTRTGPFRYVGSILEQCGVSRRYISSLAGIVRQIKGFRSWNVVLTMDYLEFQRRIALMNCSQYLKGFLNDVAGWKFTMQVCQLLAFYQKGYLTLADLKELPGYQPDFWDEFLIRFEDPYHERGRKGPVAAALRPRLVFMPEERCLAIRFPAPTYADGVRSPAVADFWRFPLTPLTRAEAWSDYYTGSIVEREGRFEEWIIPGWLPDGLPALFDTRCGFVPRGRKVDPGEYWLLIPEGYNPPCRVICELGRVFVPGNVGYRAYRVLIEPGTTVAGYELEGDDLDVSLEWVEPERFRLWCADAWADVFSGSLPALAISDPGQLDQRRVVLFYFSNSGFVRIRSEEELGEIVKDIKGSAPASGRFSLYAIGRTGRPGIDPALAEKEFLFLPRVDIRFERRLYSFNETSSVEIDEEFPGRLKLEGCYHVDPRGRKWVVPETLQQVRGTIECPGLAVNISIPVFRARLYSTDGKAVRYLVLSDLEEEVDFSLTGYPGSEGGVALWQRPASQISVTFDTRGLSRISSRQLLRLARESGHSINEVVVVTGGHTVSTGAVIIDLGSVSASVCAGDSCSISVCTTRDLYKVLDLCTKLCRGTTNGRCYDLSRVPQYHPLLDEWVFSLFACASVFDDVHVLVSGNRVNWIDRIQDQKLRQLLGFLVSFQSGHWSGERPADGEEVVPPVQRWRENVRSILDISGSGIPGLSRWSDEVVRHQTRFRSQIACIRNGHVLTRAWVYYHCGHAESALALLNNLGEVPPLLEELRDVLHVLLLLRLARLRAATEFIQAKGPGVNLEQVFSLLERVVKTLNSENPGTMRELHTNILKYLPLREEDKVLLETAAGLGRTPTVKGSDCPVVQDWLLLLLLLHSCSDPGEKAELGEQLLRLRDQIPASPDKKDILEQLARR